MVELPLNGRDFGKLVALVPGVIVEGSGVAGTEKGFNNSALNQVGITGAPATLLPIRPTFWQNTRRNSRVPGQLGSAALGQ